MTKTLWRSGDPAIVPAFECIGNFACTHVCVAAPPRAWRVRGLRVKGRWVDAPLPIGVGRWDGLRLKVVGRDPFACGGVPGCHSLFHHAD